MGKRTVTLYEDIITQVKLAEDIADDLSKEILTLTEELKHKDDIIQRLENQLRLNRSGRE
jgi:flagellin-specific chaperone FliS